MGKGRRAEDEGRVRTTGADGWIGSSSTRTNGFVGLETTVGLDGAAFRRTGWQKSRASGADDAGKQRQWGGGGGGQRRTDRRGLLNIRVKEDLRSAQLAQDERDD